GRPISGGMIGPGVIAGPGIVGPGMGAPGTAEGGVEDSPYYTGAPAPKPMQVSEQPGLGATEPPTPPAEDPQGDTQPR
ncbi:MAG TPA: hypothetical protein VK176_09165, partial [Phycisphaerales bacterium]|nr:hypothetical protein [Phycisphaerales bacterium]